MCCWTSHECNCVSGFQSILAITRELQCLGQEAANHLELRSPFCIPNAIDRGIGHEDIHSGRCNQIQDPCCELTLYIYGIAKTT